MTNDYSPPSDFPAEETKTNDQESSQTHETPKENEVRKDVFYKTKKIKFRGLKKHIILQNGTILFMNLYPGDFEVCRQEKLPSLVANTRIYDDKRISCAMNLLPSFANGANVDIKFTSIDGFATFDILGIPLYHGWITNPQDVENATEIGSKSMEKEALVASKGEGKGKMNEPVVPVTVERSVGDFSVEHNNRDYQNLCMIDLQQIRQQFVVSQHGVKFARGSIVSQLTEECVICYNDTCAERMFSVKKCCHRFCFQCVKLQIEVKLLQGMVPNCLHDGCKSDLHIDTCGKLLTPKWTEMWKQRIEESAIPVTDRVYCPYPRCSALMSKTKIFESAKSLLSLYPKSGVRRCDECCGLFCVDCKVSPWHGNMSCIEHKKLHPNLLADDSKLKSLANHKRWRQCGECGHMIELRDGCNHITCRCGFEFCHNCGGEWNKKPGSDDSNDMDYCHCV